MGEKTTSKRNIIIGILLGAILVTEIALGYWFYIMFLLFMVTYHYVTSLTHGTFSDLNQSKQSGYRYDMLVIRLLVQ